MISFSSADAAGTLNIFRSWQIRAVILDKTYSVTYDAEDGILPLKEDEAMEEFSRSALLLGDEAMEKLSRAHVAVFGVGGVGAACCEALARGGVGCMTLFDDDTVSVSNINRQLVALHSTVGQKKACVMRDRILDINPKARVIVNDVFYGPENAEDYPLEKYDYIVDCIDTVSSKLLLIRLAHEKGIPIISALGAGNKMDPTRFQVSDISKTAVCPLAKVIRTQLRKQNILHHPVVYSTEIPMSPEAAICQDGRHIPGSLSFVPPVMGMILAGEVIKTLAGFGS